MSTNRQTLRYFWRFTKPHQLLFWAGIIGSVLGVLFQDIIPPFIIAQSFAKLQTAYAAHQSLSLATFAPYAAIFAVSMILGFAVFRLQGFWIWLLETKVQRDMSIYLYNHLQRQSQSFHANRFAGSMVSQTHKFLNAYESMVDDLEQNIVKGLAALVFSMIVLVFTSWKYALVMVGVLAVYFTLMGFRNNKQMPFNFAQAKREHEETGALADNLSNISSVRTFAAEDYEVKHFGSYVERTYDANRKLSVEALKTEALSHFQTNTFNIISYLFGLVAVIQYGANVSALYLILNYTQNIVNRLWTYGHVMRSLTRAFGNASDMTELLGVKPEIKDPAEPQPVKITRGGIDFKQVGFYYEENKKNPLFENLNLRVKPGEKVGLVGPSGGGKTTITKLLLRFMDIQNGAIKIDGQDITAITQEDLRQHISYVSQEPILFHRSLHENIRYGNLEASDREIKAAAKMAHADEFIKVLPKKYDTMVGERGVKLSGGQRQRVAIARAMLKNAPILVLDEATSALDSESEALIQEALWRLMEGKTAIVIAHRLSTIQKMDRIVVLADGKIKEQGSHKELLAKNGLYAGLWNRQSGGFMED